MLLFVFVCHISLFIAGLGCLFFFFFKQKTAYELRISDWSSDVCSSDLRITSAVFFPAGNSTAASVSFSTSSPTRVIPVLTCFTSQKENETMAADRKSVV